MDNLKAKYGLEYAGKLAESTAVIVAAWIAQKGPFTMAQMDEADLLAFTEKVRASLDGSRQSSEDKPIPSAPIQKAAVPIEKSIMPDQIVCLECGDSFKSLKRHLSAHHSATPEEYRGKWGLGSDYPMVAPEYAKQRSQLAKDMGLGKLKGSLSSKVREF